MATLRVTSPSACSTSPGSRRSPAPSRPSHATETAYSTTSRYETQVSNDFGDPVAAPPAPLVDSVKPEGYACAPELARWRQERRVRRPVRISLTRISGSSKAAKCPPLPASP